MGFGKELSCKYISRSFECTDFSDVKVGGQLEKRMGLDSLESYRLKRPSGWKDHAMPRHISGKIFQLFVRLFREGFWQVNIARITNVTQGAISKILKRARQTGSPKQRPLDHHQRISIPREDRYLLRMMFVNRFLPSPKFWVGLKHHTGRRLSVYTITECLLAVGYHSHRPAWRPRLTSSALPSVGKTSSCLEHTPLAALYLHWRIKIQVTSYRWTSSDA